MTAPSPVPAAVPEPIEHGGALDAATARFGAPAAGWLDLSTGISPFPYPVGAVGAEAWRRLPSAADLDRLGAAAAACYGVADPAAVVAAPGSQALIQMLPFLRPPGRVALAGFTYGEHARGWTAAGHRVVELDDTTFETLVRDGTVRVGVVVNPNNPDGRRRDPDWLLFLADRLAAADGLLVVDEAFADLDPATSVAPAAGRPGLCVLRSFGKFFGLAGLRLGFALAPPALAAALAARLGPWAVAGPALAIGTTALADTAWQAAARSRLQRAAAALDQELAVAGLAVTGGTALFRLVADPSAPALYDRCGRAGVLLRAFGDRPAWLRIGLPRTAGERARLAEALGGGRPARP